MTNDSVEYRDTGRLTSRHWDGTIVSSMCIHLTILEMNLTVGGLLGYCSSNCMTNLNVPSSSGVSLGPIMTALQNITFSATGDAETPAGGSCCMRCHQYDYCKLYTLKSRINLLLAVVLMVTVDGRRGIDG